MNLPLVLAFIFCHPCRGGYTLFHPPDSENVDRQPSVVQRLTSNDFKEFRDFKEFSEFKELREFRESYNPYNSYISYISY